ncbi:transcriptional regulator TrmB [Ornithinimicrobium sp. F0845]|uniref:helix-turn-helix transcriptional regulator n=1 Tax=Ornithinimicrobium sp. F0845 TaxID=2926412 RepID=UPI001FF30953|nr:helix-turn-helix domain-containing protein [Ornithinimicrobium sp. F0845]MCK0110743.1 transcriptional regulator TrmB [Ornithinimicrobium sp. F0845]
MLDVLGLDPIEEATYRHLITLPSASSTDLALQLELPSAELQAALKTLAEKGLVATSTNGTGQYVASPPLVALGSLVRDRQDDLNRARSELEVLTEQYRGAAAKRTATDVIDVVTGADAVAQRFAQLQRSARTEVRALIRAGVAVVSAAENVEEDAAAERGVTYRVVLERAVLEQPGFDANIESAMSRGELVRVADRIPLRMMMADQELALIPLASAANEGRSEAGALLVHPSALLDSLVALFDYTWAAARSLAAEPTDAATRDGLDGTDLRVLTLMLSGLTDQAVGSQLGLSIRTVQRRVASLMEACGVHTRIQLGVQAERRGWLAETP